MPTISIAPCSTVHDYEVSVRRAGGDVRIVVSDDESPMDVVAASDGILLTGGGDVLPALYGQAAHPAFDAAEPRRDEYELALIRLASEADLPLFAICRGIQVLNVARGGTLVQHLPEHVSGSVEHNVRESRVAIAHEVWVTSGSLLERLMRETENDGGFPVNSRHHQAAGTVGSGLITTATAPDGIIEALEDPSKRFMLGVQWHPENFYRTGEFRALFEGFVDAARRHSQRV
jgi:gamma-glutamyl-gamma-aminobutyrate hydrolase PuuD